MYEDERFETRDVFVELTDEQRQERAKQYVYCDNQIEKLKAEQKSSNDKYKRDIGTLMNEKENLKQAVTDGRELTAVECEWVENFEQKCYFLINPNLEEDDDDYIVDQRTMTASELQGNLEFSEDDQTGSDEQNGAEDEQNSGEDEQQTDGDEQSGNEGDGDEYGEPEESPKLQPQRGKKKATKKAATKKSTAKKKSTGGKKKGALTRVK